MDQASSLRAAQDLLRKKARERHQQRQNIYRGLFCGDKGEISADGWGVLRDLFKFCKVDKSTFRSDPLEMARMEGRREVGLFVLDTLKMSEEQFYEFMATGRTPHDRVG